MKGKARFEIHLQKVENLLTKAREVKNPALWLLSNDLRTPMFMLEGLAKLYAKLHNEVIFTKLQNYFKEVEDALGGLDYFVAFQKEFALNQHIPDSVKHYFDSKIKEKSAALSDLLTESKWFSGKRLKKVRGKLGDVDWLDEEVETEALRAFYKKQVLKIEEFIKETTYDFDNIEDDVHELRRKLRWLSIYAHALQGAVKLEEALPVDEHLGKYLTDAVVGSPFNKLPEDPKQTYFLLLEKNHFLALSWMIASLGDIKDEGLKITAVQEALLETGVVKESSDTTKAYDILGSDYPTMDSLLHLASEISKQFFEEKVLRGLVK
ncbi:hypothetical protein [Dyadobacter sp. 32]|uniref:hypothetical protein n=1 Tax=Dyadobacter sp. 32 TaxID=538966 RepID=UPI0011ECDF1C